MFGLQMTLYQASTSSQTTAVGQGKTEFEILKETHRCVLLTGLHSRSTTLITDVTTPRFLREDETEGSQTDKWEEKLAKKYYDSLFREYAVCDLKHYKSGNVRPSQF